MSKLRILLVALMFTPLPSRAEPELSGVLITNGRVLLALRETKENLRAQWTEVGGKFRDYVVESYDPKAEIARLRQKDRVFDAKLTTPAVLPSAIDLSTASDEELRSMGLHRVKSGDTLGGIARKHAVKVAEVAVWNNISDPAKMKVGDILFVSAPPPNKVQ